MSDPLDTMVIVIPGVPDTYNIECKLCHDAVKHQVRAIRQFRRWIETYKAKFQREHPKCGDCTIFMGDGHVETNATAEYCSTCSHTRQKPQKRKEAAV